MKNKGNLIFLLIVVGGLALAVALGGITPILTFLGFRATGTVFDSYEREAAPLLDEWTDVIRDWEEVAINPDERPYLDVHAEAAHSRMRSLVVS